jgi:hypothetical protein
MIPQCVALGHFRPSPGDGALATLWAGLKPHLQTNSGLSKCHSRVTPGQAFIIYKRKRSRPISRVLSWTAIHLDAASPQASSNLPGNHAGRTYVPLFGLAPDGVYPATPVTSRAVRSYRTISPLPALPRQNRRYIFCGTFHRLAPPRCYLAPCPVEPGLSSPRTGRLPGRLQRSL